MSNCNGKASAVVVHHSQISAHDVQASVWAKSLIGEIRRRIIQLIALLLRPVRQVMKRKDERDFSVRFKTNVRVIRPRRGFGWMLCIVERRWTGAFRRFPEVAHKAMLNVQRVIRPQAVASS